MGPAVADVEGPGFSIREMRVEDVHDAGEVYYRAFYVDSLATGIPPAFNAPSAEAGRSLIAAMVAHPSYYNLAAFDGEGKVIGVACIDLGDSHANGVGPVAVSPDSSNRGVGKSLMKAIVEQAQKRKSPSIRLNTSGSNRKSFCLYANLGFRPVECTTSFFGTVEPDAGMQAASSVGISLDGISSRKMEEADVKACGELFSKGMGYGRENDIRAMLARWPEGCWVAKTNDGTIVGYTTGLFLLGHVMASSEAAWVAAVSGAIRAKAGVVASVTIPGVYYPRLINWALAAKLVLARAVGIISIADREDNNLTWSPVGTAGITGTSSLETIRSRKTAFSGVQAYSTDVQFSL